MNDLVVLRAVGASGASGIKPSSRLWPLTQDAAGAWLADFWLRASSFNLPTALHYMTPALYAQWLAFSDAALRLQIGIEQGRGSPLSDAAFMRAITMLNLHVTAIEVFVPSWSVPKLCCNAEAAGKWLDQQIGRDGGIAQKALRGCTRLALVHACRNPTGLAGDGAYVH